VFDPDLTVCPPGLPEHPDKEDAGYVEESRHIRREFQNSLLKWLNNSDIDGLHRIKALTIQLQRLARSGNAAQLWWVASAYAEMMALRPEDEGVTRKHIPARLDQLLRKLIDQGEAVLVRERDEALLREMLYDIGSSSCDSELLTEVRKAFDLNRLLRDDVDEGTQKSESMSPDPAAGLDAEIGSVARQLPDPAGGAWLVSDGELLPEPETDIPEEPVLDNTVIRNFTQETLGHIAILRAFLGSRTPFVSPDLLGAVHRLRSTSRSLHLVEMSNIFHALDEQINSVHGRGSGLTQVHIRALDKAAILSAQVLERLNTDQTFPAALRREFDRLLEELDCGGASDPGTTLQNPATGMPGMGLLGELLSAGEADVSERPVGMPSGTAVKDIDDIRMVFLDESMDILGRINKEIEDWPAGADRNRSLASIRRELHTLKGGAYGAGFGEMGDLGHQTETLLQYQEGGLEIKEEELRSLLEEVHDSLSEMVDRIRQGAQVQEPWHLNQRLSALVSSGTPDVHPAEGVEPEEGMVPGNESNLGEAPGAESGTGHELLRINSGMLDKLVNYAGELNITRAQLKEHLATLRSDLGDLSSNIERFGAQLRQLELQADSQIRSDLNEPAQAQEAGDPRGSEFDPLQMDRYTRLQQLTRGLSESLDDLMTIQTGIMRYVHASESVLQQQAQLGVELQDGLMSTRLVPFSTVLPRLRHQARLTARELQKEAEVRITGGAVEIDRKVLDGIAEALDHMVRNAVVHGVELPAERESIGKQRKGSISIECRQRGNEIAVSFGDDGRGLDIETILAKAIDLGLVEPGDPVTEHQILQLIVRPGFTTATEVTQLSGRGMGLDVVHDAVRRLGGHIAVDSRPGLETVFEISLPVSLSIAQAIFVRCGRQQFVIPLNSVQSVMKADTGEILPSADGRPVFGKDGETYPLLDLPQCLGLGGDVQEEKRQAILIARMGATEVAVKVSELLGSQEVVVKSPGSHLSGIEGIAGATIRGDGRVVVILDLAELWIAHERRSVTDATGPEASEKQPLIMVVDDSLTVRKVTARNLSRHGMEVVMARDGIDALDLMANRRPDLMLVDIEMPRMDGYELTKRVRDDPVTSHIPIIVITSRAGSKHQQKAMALGADDYLIKPYQEQELINHVERSLAACGIRHPQE